MWKIARRNEINKDGFKFFNSANDNEENFYTLESLYVHWAEDTIKASNALWAMFEEECSEYFN